jgi:hypothetical protein
MAEAEFLSRRKKCHACTVAFQQLSNPDAWITARQEKPHWRFVIAPKR